MPVARAVAGPLLALAVCAVADPAAALPGDLPFHVDVASFPDSLGRPVTRLYLNLPLSALSFEDGAGDRATADVLVRATFYDKKKRRIDGNEWIYRGIPGAPAREDNEGRSLQRRFEFRVPEGEGRVEVAVEDLRSGRRGGQELELKVPSFGSTPLRLSDLVFGVCGDFVVAAARDNWEGDVLPHPSRTYGDRAPVVCVYAEVSDTASARPDSTYRVRLRVRERGGRERQDTTLAVRRERGRGALLLRPELAGLGAGEYRLRVDVSLGPHRADREGSFRMDETRVSWPRDPDLLRTVLGYVATNEELIQIEDAPDDSLEALWERFWGRRDPSPETAANEALLEFMRRVEHATRRFGVFEPGWRSDMGRIHIKYGAPDLVERVGNDPLGAPTEIWYYYARHATFVFQDPDGFGRYRLVGTRRE
jgi:GWxTD domain-containing protein